MNTATDYLPAPVPDPLPPAVVMFTNRGWKVDSYTATTATLSRPVRTAFWKVELTVHLLLVVATMGLWLFGWALLAAHRQSDNTVTDHRHRRVQLVLTVDAAGVLHVLELN